VNIIQSVMALSFVALGRSVDLKIDPLMIVATGEVWDVIAKPENPVWPGWNAADTPILIYLPDVQDVLINHPKPPSDFTPYEGPIQVKAGAIFIRDGKTLIDFDGQNTSREVFGVETLVVADTLSSRKQSVSYWLSDSRAVEDKIRELSYDQLRPNPYDHLALVAHEAFHVFQFRKAPNKGGNELALAQYPALSVKNNVGWAMEGEALAAALRANTPKEVRSAALRWLAVRQDRRKSLPEVVIAYEDGTEFNEGLAKYVEYRLFQVLQNRTPNPRMFTAQGFRGYADLDVERERLIEAMVSHLRGEVNVNNDPYGAAPARMRLYFSGMAIAAFLDRMGATGWHERILQPSTTLVGLAEKVLAAGAEELPAALKEAQSSPGHDELIRRKEQLEREGQGFASRILEGIVDNPHGVVVVDYSALGSPQVNLSFTPFGILSVDDSRTIYRMIPLAAGIGSTRITQTESLPSLVDKKTKQLVFPLTGDARAVVASLAAIGNPEPRNWEAFEFRGVKFEGLWGTIRQDGKRLIVELKPK